MADAHWDSDHASYLPRKHLLTERYRASTYRSIHLVMRDGIRLAVDILLPSSTHFDLSRGVPCILHQTRYHRHMHLRRPFSSLLNDGKPIDFVNYLTKRLFLSMGFAIVSMDVRGTGASFGKWQHAWSMDERRDAREVLDWISRQSWSNRRIIPYGISYDGTAAIWAAGLQHASIAGVVTRYPFWDVYADIAMPNGAPMRSFFEQWMALNRALDANRISMLPIAGWMAAMVVRGVVPALVVEETLAGGGGDGDGGGGGGKGVDSSVEEGNGEVEVAVVEAALAAALTTTGKKNDSTGQGPLRGTSIERGQEVVHAVEHVSMKSSSTSLPASSPSTTASTLPPPPPTPPTNHEDASSPPLPRTKATRAAAKFLRLASHSRLREAIAEHQSWDLLSDINQVRYIDETGPSAGIHVEEITTAMVSDAIRAAQCPFYIESGWLDATAYASCAIYHSLTNHDENTTNNTNTNNTSAPKHKLVIGPWSHVGLMNTCRGFDARQAFSRFPHTTDYVHFALFHALREGERPVVRLPAPWRGLGELGRRDESNAGVVVGTNRSVASSSSSSWWLRLGRLFASSKQTQPRPPSPPSSSTTTTTTTITSPSSSSNHHPIHFFVMGHHSGWRHFDTLPNTPPSSISSCSLYFIKPTRLTSLAAKCNCLSFADDPGLALHLDDALNPSFPSSLVHEEQLRIEIPSSSSSSSSSSSHPTGTSRYDAMTNPLVPISYRRMDRLGLLFTSPRLDRDMTLATTAIAELWIESSYPDTDLFVYLQNYDATSGAFEYVTEGMVRASHATEASSAEALGVRRAAVLPHHPRMTHKQADARPLPRHGAVCVRFVMLPTAYTFRKGSCVRVTITTSDKKHFTDDAIERAKTSGLCAKGEGWVGSGWEATERHVWLHGGKSRLILPLV